MKKINLLFTSVGRRVVLINLFRKALTDLAIDGKIFAADASENAAARYVADEHITTPKLHDPHYINELLTICKKHAINIIIPLIDTELLLLAINRNLFEALGITILLSSRSDIEMCSNKRLTNEFFLQNNFAAPLIFEPKTILNTQNYQLPLFIKPIDGSSSINAFKVNNEEELKFFLKYIPHPVLQEFVNGQEYTIDVLVDFSGQVRCVVPRLRIATRAGEISKGVTVKNQLLITAAKSLIEKMQQPLGCITVQCFLTADKEVKFIEINPRFGGGFPLSCVAGANFPLWILQMYLKQPLEIPIDGWIAGIKMLRYDDAIFLQGTDIL